MGPMIACTLCWHNLEALGIVSVHEGNKGNIKSQFEVL